ncbi:MAG: APC family permease [Minwuia sp.]|uniref:APC family permease n=1 Tax=Minwuia sp. TaxID=2493630 RepID=UPI003A87DB5F
MTAELKRSLSLPLVVLYGLGVTIGAGIYVLLSATAAEAGVHAPLAFVAASVVMAFSAASFAELSARFPVSAGEAAYVREGLRSQTLSAVTGYLVIGSGIVSSAAITAGSVGYILEFVSVPEPLLIVAVVVFVTAVAAWGIVESVAFASLFTLVEAGALIVIIWAGFDQSPGIVSGLPSVLPPIDSIAPWIGIAGAGLLAFFAFIGFEDIVNLAEEVKRPERTLPWAIAITLVVATAIYFLVATVAVLSLPLDELAASRSPVSLLFDRVTGISPTAVTAIAIVATLNGVIIQIIMASRVLYGLSRQGGAPAMFGNINARTRTPLTATFTAAACVLVLALGFPLEHLAEWTSRIALTVFTLANLALLRIKFGEGRARPAGFSVPAWVPAAGAISCIGLLLADLATIFTG